MGAFLLESEPPRQAENMTLFRPASLLRPTPLFALGLMLVLATILLSYSPGIARGFEFDDLHNFIGLEGIHNLDSALTYIFTGDAGPLGRPLALASFAAQFYAWSDAPEIILRVNLLIHTLNTVLLCSIALRLARDFIPTLRYPERFALLAAALWGLSPLLASASLFAVQRMTTLSATFMLLGLLCHLVLLPRLARHPRRIALALVGSLALFTVLAALTKEGGALLPLLVLCLHLTVLPLRQPELPHPWRHWPLAAFALPLLAVLWVLAGGLSPHAYDPRSFNLTERLLTEARILVDYLHIFFLPAQNQLGPYHDDYPVSSALLQPAQTLFCLVLLAVLVILAVSKRRQWPFFALATLWFLSGHMLESTTLPLELYFEHRNYVPTIGLALALAALPFTVPPAYTRLTSVIACAYLALITVVLWQTTTVWGDRLLSAELWAASHPDSTRATQNYAESLKRQGRAEEGLETLRAYSLRHPDEFGTALQVAYMDARIHRSLPPLTDFIHHDARLRQGLPDLMVCQILDEILELPGDHPFLQDDGIIMLSELGTALLANPKLSAGRREIRFCVNRFAASIALTRRDLEATMLHLEAAFDALPLLGIGLQLVRFPASAGLFDAARENLARVRSAMPRNPILRRAWEEALNQAEIELKQETARDRAVPP
ncbi:hypothetical protein AGMMS49543_13660 [Betaproteobacteria bacterium]|nr:hypothetical protein AGMMS49543_13660 [Betaproteobacteria bacterium]GHU15851.1 hypothetical protein AGMMS50243_00460 [Betaproteobacteria bacterium]